MFGNVLFLVSKAVATPRNGQRKTVDPLDPGKDPIGSWQGWALVLARTLWTDPLDRPKAAVRRPPFAWDRPDLTKYFHPGSSRTYQWRQHC